MRPLRAILAGAAAAACAARASHPPLPWPPDRSRRARVAPGTAAGPRGHSGRYPSGRSETSSSSGAPNRGLLITGGNKPSIEPGIWTYDGAAGTSSRTSAAPNADGRIAWAGPDDFWTVSDGRPGQAAEAIGTSEERSRAAQRQHAVSLRRRSDRRLLRASRLRSRFLPADAGRRVPRTRRTAGSAANRCRNPRSAPSSCTGTAARWKPNPIR